MTRNEMIRNPHLAGDDFFWKGNHTGVLLIHGFTATTAEVRLMAEKLHQEGFTTSGPLLPGHGTHPDELNRTSKNMWMEKVNQSYRALSSQCTRIFVIGESMGALLAIELAVQNPEITGLMLFTPAIKVNNLWTAQFIAPFRKYLVKKIKDDGLPWQGYNVYPLKAAVEMLKLQKHTHKQLQNITQPTLVFTGEFDQTITPESAEIILKGIQSTSKQRIHMENSGHCILLDKELDKAVTCVLDFIQEN